ncbi:hypothetical protein, partial [Planomonospora algeriensis]
MGVLRIGGHAGEGLGEFVEGLRDLDADFGAGLSADLRDLRDRDLRDLRDRDLRDLRDRDL